MTDRDNITLPREVVEGALEALDSEHPDIQLRAAIALRKALAAEQPKQEPVALADRLDDERMNLIERLADENERLREALKLALNSHGRMLMSDPPQDAWKFYRVNEVIAAALRREEAKP